MGYIGTKPSAVPLTSADITDGIITSAKIANGAIVGDDINSTFNLTGKTVTLPAGVGGKVLQVVSTTKSDTFSSSAINAFTDITGLSVSITPSSASNKILIIAIVQAHNVNTNGYLRLVRGATAIGVGDTAGDRSSVSGSNMTNAVASFIGTNAFQFLDSPATTSSTTYKIQFITDGATTLINRSSIDTNFLYIGRSQSTITVMEIAG